MKKKFISALLAISLTFSLSIPVFAGTWEHQLNPYNNKYYWKYKKDDGQYALVGWYQIDNEWYHFIGGHAEADTTIDEYNTGNHYIVDTNCKMVKGGFYSYAKYNGKYKAFTDSSGKIVNGFFMVDDVLYYVGEEIGGNIPDINTTYRGETRDKFQCADGKERTLHYIYDGGKVLELDGNPIKSDDKFYQLIKYIPKYNSQGVLVGEIRN